MLAHAECVNLHIGTVQLCIETKNATFCICLTHRWPVMVLKHETSACRGTTARLMQPAALSLTATLLPRTRNRWPWLRAKVGHPCLSPLTKSLVAQGASHQGHFCCDFASLDTMIVSCYRVDKTCRKQGVILRSLVYAEQHKHWLLRGLPALSVQANSPSRFVSCVSCLPFKLEIILLCEAPAVRCLQEKPSALLLALV